MGTSTKVNPPVLQYDLAEPDTAGSTEMWIVPMIWHEQHFRPKAADFQLKPDQGTEAGGKAQCGRDLRGYFGRDPIKNTSLIHAPG